MAEKDITEKMLEDYNDVFCDMVNVFLFDGKRIVKEGELENIKTKSQLKIFNQIHEQERDVAKLWLRNNIRIALIGMENQTSYDRYLPLRVMSYDGASYKEQMSEIDKCIREGKETPKLVPVVTFIIYFGEERWRKTNLYEVIEIPDHLKKYINNYNINVFDIKDLTREQVDSFQSDFRIVADYFYKKYHCEGYQPDDTVIKHVDEVLKLMTALTGDRRYEQVINDLLDSEKEEVHMCEVLDKVEARGIEIGEARGIEIGEARGLEMGEEKLSKLLGALKEAGRMDDFDLAISDKEYRKKLYKEFGI